MSKKMVKIPDGVVIYSGKAKYKGEAPEHLVKEQNIKPVEDKPKAKARDK